jgi:hypothetical protein
MITTWVWRSGQWRLLVEVEMPIKKGTVASLTDLLSEGASGPTRG